MSTDHSLTPDPAAAGLASDLGVIVMAHGGDEERRRGVLECTEPLTGRYPLEVAFGIGDPATTQAAINALETRGARRIAILRLLISGNSYRDRTEKVLGLRPGAAPRPEASDDEAIRSAESGGHAPAPWRVSFNVPFALGEAGLGDDPRMGEILATRASDLSESPATEDVLVLAHGAGDDDENDRWVAALDRLADAVRTTLPFRRVHVETLREDWPDKRAGAERRIRDLVHRAAAGSGTAIVIPFRVHGFGPYEQVLDGLDYVADGRGLIPHPYVTEWIEEQLESMRDAKYIGSA